MKTEKKQLMKMKKKCIIKNGTVREMLAEALGTFVMMSFGLGSVAQVVLGKKEYGQYLSINLSFGFGVTMGIHVAGGISGAHMNTSVSLTNCILGHLPWRKLPFYALGQFIGSFLAAALVYCVYYDALYDYCGGNLTVTGPYATAGIFSTYPAAYMTPGGGFLTEFVATGMLLLCILAINDKKNFATLDGTQALLVGILVIVIGMAMGMNTGYAINPARDLPPRIFTAIAGWGVEVFRAGNYWCWIPVVAPLAGSITGAFIYKLVIALHNQTVSDDAECEDTKENSDINVSSQYM
ncbi:aquaporin-7 [Microcaecilia unicolor]|uniref:Aquaporin-7-like n=1 Tax=Microcaecilia unicolor TaxID=1415580 RepID=A0A6P7WX18_9AMPH|nr:aquaporin-7-like [Microcaecilia unicolor]